MVVEVDSVLVLKSSGKYAAAARDDSDVSYICLFVSGIVASYDKKNHSLLVCTYHELALGRSWSGCFQ